MSGRARLTLCATLASLLTAFSLLPLASPMTWFARALLLVLLQAGLGAAVRRAPVARPVTVLAQVLITLMLITLAFAPRQAVLLVLPGPQALQHLGHLVGQGVTDVGQYAIPAPVTAGIRLLLVGGVMVVALLVDVVAVSYASAAVAGLPLLALYSIASGLGSGSGRWVWFLPAAGGYLVLLLAEGRDRLSRWGRVFSGTPRRGPSGAPQPVREGDGPPPTAARSGRRIAAMALGAALVVPLVLPSLNGGLLGPAAGTGLGRGGDITTIDPVVSLQNSLNQPDDHEVLAYRTSSDQGLYLRIVTLDRFDVDSWQPSRRTVTAVPSTLPQPQGLGAGVRTGQIISSVATASDYQDNYLPLPYPATRVAVNGQWRYEPVGRDIVGAGHQTTSGVKYQVSSLDLDPTAAQLASAPPPPAALKAEYTRVPSNLPPVVAGTARSVTRGATNDYEKAFKLQTWFTTTGGFTYDTDVAPGHGPQAIADFLKDKRGFCVHFAFSMAAMARTLGIPARVDVGFVPGTQQGNGTWKVGVKDAHAWPELYFQGIGWTRFEPTPSRGSAPDYARDSQGGPDGGDVPVPQLSAHPTAGAGPSTAPHCAGADRRLGDCSAGDDGTIGAPAASSGSSAGPVAALITVVVLALLGCAPMVWRRRLRRRRLGAGRRGPGGSPAGGSGDRGPEADASGGPPGGGRRGPGGGRSAVGASGGGAGAAGAVLLDDPPDGTRADAWRTMDAWWELVDTAWDYGLAPRTAQTPRSAADRLITEAGLSGAAEGALLRVRDAVEQTLYAERPRPFPDVTHDVREVLRALHAGAVPATRLRALLAPRSARRALWRWRSRSSSVWTRTRSAATTVARGAAWGRRARGGGAARRGEDDRG